MVRENDGWEDRKGWKLLHGEAGHILKVRGGDSGKQRQDRESILIKANSRNMRQFYWGGNFLWLYGGSL